MPEFSMDNASDRAALIVALNERDMPAAEKHFGGGVMAVSVVILHDDSAQEFTIDAMADVTPCQIGLSGYRTEPDENEGEAIDVLSDSSAHANNIEEACAAFLSYWNQQDDLIKKFHAGKFDVPITEGGEE